MGASRPEIDSHAICDEATGEGLTASGAGISPSGSASSRSPDLPPKIRHERPLGWFGGKLTDSGTAQPREQMFTPHCQYEGRGGAVRQLTLRFAEEGEGKNVNVM